MNTPAELEYEAAHLRAKWAREAEIAVQSHEHDYTLASNLPVMMEASYEKQVMADFLALPCNLGKDRHMACHKEYYSYRKQRWAADQPTF